MASTIKVDKIEGSSGSTITVPTGQTLTVTDGIPVASGGTGLASFTQGDILYATGATTLVKLAKGTGRQGLQTNSGATAPEWTDSPQSLMTAAGDVLYASGANTLAKLAKGSDDDVLTLASGVPSWASATAGGKIVQMTYTRSTDLVSWTHGSAGVADELTTTNRVTITPTSTSNELILEAFVPLTGGGTTSIYNFMFYNVTDGALFNPSTEAIGSRGTWGYGIGGHRGPHQDTNDQNILYLRQIGPCPSTSATTFAIYGRGQSGSPFYINHDSGGDSTWGFIGQTLFTATEVDIA